MTVAVGQMQALDLLKLPLLGSRLIEASAGTGKTYTIAALYLRAVLGHAVAATDFSPLIPPQILVVTFTDAATGELTERIRHRLTDAARYFRQEHSEADPILAQLAASYPQQQWPECAAKLDMAAQWMDEAAISTIHGWCQRMLAEHAFASGCRFEDELSADQSALIQAAVEDYWRCFVYGLDVPTFVRWQRSFRSPQTLWKEMAGIWREQPLAVAAAPTQLIKDEQQQRQQQLAALKAPWLTWLPELADLLAEAIVQKRVNGSKVRADYVKKWLAGIEAWAKDPAQTQLDIGSGATRLTPAGMADACKGEPLVHPAFVAMEALIPALAALPDCSEDLRQHALAWCQQRFIQSQLEQGCFGFDDMLDRLHQALQGPHGAELAARIRRQYPLAMIDEFQDTDPVQYGIFDRIYQLSTVRDDVGILLIGDPKQAIYAFRGADIYTYLKAKQATAPRHYSLNTNFRSSSAMVQAVNQMFLQAEQRSSCYGAFLFRQQANLVAFDAVQAKGRKEVFCHQGDVLPAMELVVFDPSDKPCSKALYFEQMAQHCASKIAELLQQGALGITGFQACSAALDAGEGVHSVGIQPADIAVLVNNQQEADCIRKALLRVGVRSVYLSDKGSVFETSIAADLLLWLEACADPYNDQKVRSALACQTLDWPYSQVALLQQDEWFFEYWLTTFSQLQRLWQQQGILPLVRHLLSKFNLIERLAGRDDGERQLTDLLHLAELLQHVSQTLVGEQALLRYFKEHLAGTQQLEADMLKLRLESDEALVRVVTIHKSKGLEYPVVFLPFIAAAKPLDPVQLPYRYHTETQELKLCYQADPQVFALAERERLGEDLRKLYVALTRARHYCYLGLAPLKELSAIGYLLTDDGMFKPSQMLGQLQALQTMGIQITPWHAASARFEPPDNPAAQRIEKSYAVMPKRTRTPWWAASYSAIAAGAGQAHAANMATATFQPHDDLILDVDKNAELFSELGPDLPAVSTDTQFSQGYIRGASAGTLLHDCLEWAAEQGFASVCADPAPFLQFVVAQCTKLRWIWPQSQGDSLRWHRRLVLSDAEEQPLFPSAEHAVAPLWQWLLALIQSPWWCEQQRLSLHTLTEYRAELEFWFQATTVASGHIDQLLQQHLWPGQSRPALQPKLINGMLKGFIDLTFVANGKYHVADYKSNFIASGDYSAPQLVQIMLEKRYDLQAALYALALHRLLQSRLSNYQPELHLGQAYYWFVRGANTSELDLSNPSNSPSSESIASQSALQGMLAVTIHLELVLALDKLFKGNPQ